jgi:hypothetical protein
MCEFACNLDLLLSQFAGYDAPTISDGKHDCELHK